MIIPRSNSSSREGSVTVSALTLSLCLVSSSPKFQHHWSGSGQRTSSGPSLSIANSNLEPGEVMDREMKQIFVEIRAHRDLCANIDVNHYTGDSERKQP